MTQIQTSATNSFVPIRPKQEMPGPFSVYKMAYKSNNVHRPTILSAARQPIRIAPRPSQYPGSAQVSFSSVSSLSQPCQLKTFPMPEPESVSFDELNEAEREKYLVARKRKRKQDLSVLAGRLVTLVDVEPGPMIEVKRARSLDDDDDDEPETTEEISFEELNDDDDEDEDADDEETTQSEESGAKASPAHSSPLIISTTSLFKARRSSKKSSSSSTSDYEHFYGAVFDDDQNEDECDENDIVVGGSNSMSCYSSDSDDADDAHADTQSKGSSRKTIPPNIHSLRERERRFRLKKLLLKLQLSFLDVDCSNLNDSDLTETALKVNKMFKVRSSKQAILHEVISINSLLLTFHSKLFTHKYSYEIYISNI